MSLRALIFDVDGTLVDTEELHRQAFNEAFLEFDLGWDWGAETYAEMLTVSGGGDRIASYIDRLSLPAAEKSRLRQIAPMLHREKTRIYGNLLGSSAVRLRPGVARLIKEALNDGLAVGLAATSASINVRSLVEAAFDRKTREAIAAIVCADHVARKKPAPDLYELLLSTLRLSAAGCIAFEDSANGVAAAKAAGLWTVATPSRWTCTQDFTGADLLLPTLGDPDQPIEPSDVACIGGARWLGLAQLDELRAPRIRTDAKRLEVES